MPINYKTVKNFYELKLPSFRKIWWIHEAYLEINMSEKMLIKKLMKLFYTYMYI